MKLFVDTADPGEVRVCFDRRLAEGVSTSLSLTSAALAELCGSSSGPVSVAVESVDRDGMIREARALARLGPQVVARLPLTVEGLKAVRACAEERIIPTHVSACESPAQAVLAAKAGARYLSPGGDRPGSHRTELVRSISATYRTYGFATQVVAPVGTASDVVDVAMAGAAVAAVPFAILQQVIKTPAPDGGAAEARK